MDPATLYLLVEGYLHHPPGAVKETTAADGASARSNY